MSVYTAPPDPTSLEVYAMLPSGMTITIGSTLSGFSGLVAADPEVDDPAIRAPLTVSQNVPLTHGACTTVIGLGSGKCSLGDEGLTDDTYIATWVLMRVET